MSGPHGRPFIGIIVWQINFNKTACLRACVTFILCARGFPKSVRPTFMGAAHCLRSHLAAAPTASRRATKSET